MQRVTFLSLLVIPLFSLGRTARAGVVGLVSAANENQVTITAVEEDGEPKLAVIQSHRNCPITIVPGSAFNPGLVHKDADETFVMVSLYDDEPVLKKCEGDHTSDASTQVFPIRAIFDKYIDAVESVLQKKRSQLELVEKMTPGLKEESDQKLAEKALARLHHDITWLEGQRAYYNEAKDAFFDKDAPLVVVLQETWPGSYDLHLNAGKVSLKEIKREPTVIFQSKLKDPHAN